jgi:hypothetical protein
MRIFDFIVLFFNSFTVKFSGLAQGELSGQLENLVKDRQSKIADALALETKSTQKMIRNIADKAAV